MALCPRLKRAVAMSRPFLSGQCNRTNGGSYSSYNTSMCEQQTQWPFHDTDQRMTSLLPHPNLHSPPSLFSPPSPSASSSRLSTSLLCGQFQRNNHNYKKRCQQRSLHPSLHFLPAQQNRDKWITASFVVMPALWWQMVHQSSLTLSALALMNVTV